MTAKTSSKKKVNKKTKSTRKKPGSSRKRLTPRSEKRGLAGAEVRLDIEGPELQSVVERVRQVAEMPVSAYHPFLKRIDCFAKTSHLKSLQQRQGWAACLFDIDEQVKKIIEKLKSRGFRSPYRRSYVVARINPVRFHRAKKGDTTPPMDIGPALTRMAASLRKFDVDSVREQDLALVGAVAGGDE